MNSNLKYSQSENQEVDQLREQEQQIFNNLKVASIGIVRGITQTGYIVELIPKLDGEYGSIQTVNFIYEKEHLVHSNYASYDDESAYIVKKTVHRQIKDEAVGKFILILFLDNHISQMGNEKLNIDGTKTKHSYTNGYALAFIENWPGKEGKI